jgi:hypothetical protein
MNFAPLLTTSDLEFDYEPGVRAYLGVPAWPGWLCTSWEVGYLGIFESDSLGQVVDDEDGLFAPGDLGFGAVNGFVFADSFTADYASDLHALELNAVRCFCQSCEQQVDLLFGFRYLSFDEDFALFTDNVSPQVSASYAVATKNELYGAQLGGRLRGTRGRWGFELMGKGGVYVNEASQEQRIVDQLPSNPVVLRNTSADGTNAAFVGEFGLSLLCRVTQHWTLRGGYSLFWMEGLALAPNQLDFSFQDTSGSLLDSEGGVFYHGANVGLELRL